MAVAVDASSPVRWSAAMASHDQTIGSSAAFTPPNNSILVVCVSDDTTAAENPPLTVSGGSLTWTTRVERTGTETTAGGASHIYTAVVVTGASMSVTLARGGTGTASTGRVSAKCYVLTGADAGGTPVDAVGANNEGGSATNSMTTTSITAGANGLLICCDTDWNALGVFQASSDLTQDTADYASAISVCSGYKAVTSGASVNGNLNAGGTAAAQHKWCQVVVREAAAAAAWTPPGQGLGLPPAMFAMRHGPRPGEGVPGRASRRRRREWERQLRRAG